jgi:DNA replication protein DnaC
MSITEIEQCLKRLRLAGIRVSFEARALQAQQGNMAFIDFLSLLLQDEIDRRRSRFIERNFSVSGLPERKTLDDFDWHFNPKVPKRDCLELLALKFISQGEDALLLGRPGTGKSHIAMSISHAAILRGFRVFYREAHELFPEIHEATQLGNRSKLMRNISNADLVVIDDLFLRKLPSTAGDDLQEIILNRYKFRKATLITSNRVIDDWGQCLGDNMAASTILDRLMHRGHLLQFEGRSYRLKEAAIRLASKKEKH